MFSLKELYDLKELLNSLSDDLRYFKDEQCGEAPVIVFNCLKNEDKRIGRLIVKITDVIADIERDSYDDLPFSS